MVGHGASCLCTTLIVHAFVVATVLGACKKAGWISVNPKKIKNKTMGKLFDAMVHYGEAVVNMVTEVYTAAQSPAKKA
eukprot:jgi/Mesen1/4235/ME000022S03520